MEFSDDGRSPVAVITIMVQDDGLKVFWCLYLTDLGK